MTVGSSGEPLEIERKFLIRMPEKERLASESERHIAITQIYLCTGPEGGSRRLRHSRWDGGEARYYTEKRRLTHRTRVEWEREVDPEEYDALLTEADRTLRPIEKVRWCVPYAGHTLEIDVFPFWGDRAFLEAELTSEDEELRLPDWIRVIREVTEDERYTNLALAREIPDEPLESRG